MISYLRRNALLFALGGWLVLTGSTAQAADPSVKELIGQLKSSEESVRLKAIDQLGAEGEKAAEAVAPLAELLKNGSASSASTCCPGSRRNRRPAKSAATELTSLLKDPDDKVRRQAVTCTDRHSTGPESHDPAVHQAHGGLRSGRSNADFECCRRSRRSRGAGFDRSAQK